MEVFDILLGTAIGDAYGAGVEFQDREWIRANVDFQTFVNSRDTIQVPEEKKSLFTDNYHAWNYTDDTEMTIGVLKALISKEPFTEDLLVRMWREEYEKGIREKGYGRNGHGSMSWYYSGDKTIEEIKSFQRNRPNPGNAPAMRSVLFGLLPEKKINGFAKINAEATHPNIHAILSSQCIARAAEYLIVKQEDPQYIIDYCMRSISINALYQDYLTAVDLLPQYNDLEETNFETLCGPQPIQSPYFLPGIKGVPSDSMFTAGCVLFVLKNCTDAFDALKKSILLGGDVDSVASITTGIMGGVSGLSSIPEFMHTHVEGKQYFEALGNQYNQHFPS
ncbi:MAG: ADP-ribosylglycohydrolase family protein [Saprospiraceae bacterium]|nr:ADP-ribosylglycohydrolase family protein [Saprospiraceae bacterium]